jgi:hypothetical protein
MAKSKVTVKSKGVLLLNFSVAIYLFATGVMGIMGTNGGGEIGAAVASLLNSTTSDVARVMIIVLSVVAIAAGIFIFIKLFGVSISNTETLLIILAVVWLIFIVMVDIIFPIGSGKNFISLEWLRTLGSHTMVLAAITLGTSKFGI